MPSDSSPSSPRSVTLTFDVRSTKSSMSLSSRSRARALYCECEPSYVFREPSGEMLPRTIVRGAVLRALLAAGMNFGPARRAVAAPAAQLAAVLSDGRVPGIGGGTDLQAVDRFQATDVLYPPAILGEWQLYRVVSSVEGDAGQAETAWRVLGGHGDFRKPEEHMIRFVPSRHGQVGVVADRGWEYAQRTGAQVEWSIAQPDKLRARTAAGVVTLAVVQRDIEPFQQEPPYGFGTSELLRVTSPAGGLMGKGVSLERAIKVSRRYRPTADGIDVLEIVKTYRVMDGVAGTEMPTSLTKSRLKLQRPTDQTRVGL